MSQLSLTELEAYALENASFDLSTLDHDQLTRSFEFLKEFSSDKIIYGINTGFGPMAQYKVEDDKLNQLQYNLIRSHSTGTGDQLDEPYVRAVLVARINNFLQGNSGISLEVIEKLIEFLNKGVVPEIYEHGGVGASGDLVQLAHLALNLIGEGYVFKDGKRYKTADLLNQLGIKPLNIKLRDGLGLINGTSCMTGISSINLIYAKRLLNWGVITSSIVNEVVAAFDDSFSHGLNSAKRHEGQLWIASQMREFLGDSELIRKREELFNDTNEIRKTEFRKKIQEYYSVRCVPQILGPVKETLDAAQRVIEAELNSTNDNPVVSVDDQNVYHGGNFHGDYVSLEMDKVKLVVTRLTMLAERQLNFLLNARLNDKFPAFLNLEKLGFNFGIQGLQFTAVSTTAENQTLSNSMYVHSIPNNNDNQDIVSMGTNSALITKRVIENGYQVMAIHVIAVCQAIDLLSEEEKAKLGTQTQSIYKRVRAVVSEIREDLPQSENILRVINLLKTNQVEL